MRRALIVALALTACTVAKPAPQATPAATTTSSQQQQPQPSQTPADPVAGFEKFDGFIPLYWDAPKGRLLMEIPRLGEELLYQVSLASGVGSNPIGLDRSQLGATHIVRFDRVGPRVLMTEPNYGFRALSNDAAEQRSVEQSFAQSVLAGFTVESTLPNGHVLVDATDFFLSDAHGVAARLRRAQQGSFSLDKNRSAIYLPRTKAFPRNTEVEATLTFASSDPGELVRGVTPTAEALTVREHHSLVALPEPGFTPRRADPRVGIFGIDFYDYASPFTTSISKHWIARHRLIKKDPNAAVSDPVQPIVYYVDNGVPEPIRSALLEGASWWNAAFEAAGFHNAFQVKVLPPDADPLDIRYNIINWVHRSTRGWSYGASVVDPRTGEIIKGNVLLGSLRIRQDAMIARGMAATFDDMDPTTSPSMMALARIRQLSAHETGHTLGLDHNFAASTYGRASVMDYPAPYIKITNGKLDFSEAYATGVAAYDIAAIKYAYAQFAPGANEDAELTKLARATPLFVSDPHSRPVSSAHPLGAVWDNGADPIAMLRHEIDVRRIALDQFGLNNLSVGEPVSALEEKLVPLYLHHRYQLEAAAKSIGGIYYTYAVKDAEGVWPDVVRKVVPAAQQRDALRAIMTTLDPAFLALPQRVLDLLPPPAYGHGDANTELFPRRTDPAFDPISAAMTSADVTISALLDPARCARVTQQTDNVTMREITNALIDAAVKSGPIPRATRTLLMVRLAGLAAGADNDAQVRADATDALRRLSDRLAATSSDPAEAAHRRLTRDDIARFLARPAEAWKPSAIPTVPPGPPI
ncbi:MAG: zinc-dependent metalloprotease [Acidobacteria bacterium]|nr:zinc-dependent metalloprotease [Acidobacteriota bacterium]MBV9477969.1 zinc-dependent metalloprotease [Acidobacteriota bacterium]